MALCIKFNKSVRSCHIGRGCYENDNRPNADTGGCGDCKHFRKE